MKPKTKNPPKIQIFMRKNEGGIAPYEVKSKMALFALLSETPPPSINGSYAAGMMNTGETLPDGSAKTRSVLYHTEGASTWKTLATRAVTIASSGNDPMLGAGPYCTCSWLFAFENYDIDNRLKIVNDSFQGICKKQPGGFVLHSPRAIDDDKYIRRSMQFKTVVRKKKDIAFFHVAAPIQMFDHLYKTFEKGVERFEDTSTGMLFSEFEGRVRKMLVNFIEEQLKLEMRLG